MSLGKTVRRLVTVLLYNGVEIAEHASVEGAEKAIDRLSKSVGTDRTCFATREVWR